MPIDRNKYKINLRVDKSSILFLKRTGIERKFLDIICPAYSKTADPAVFWEVCGKLINNAREERGKRGTVRWKGKMEIDCLVADSLKGAF